MFDRGCSRLSRVGAHARACPRRRPCPLVAFFVVGFSFQPPTDVTQRLAARIPRFSSRRSPHSPKSNITTAHRKIRTNKELTRRLSGGTIYVKIPDQFRPGTIGTTRRRLTLTSSATNTGGNHAEVCYCACGGDHGRRDSPGRGTSWFLCGTWRYWHRRWLAWVLWPWPVLLSPPPLPPLAARTLRSRLVGKL